ncbi:MAG: rhodanese-like domain-containing protein [Bacteroidetes bacterium]|nr:rhodanese-like domain-containing protein [Bacteroidota bacterium]
MKTKHLLFATLLFAVISCSNNSNTLTVADFKKSLSDSTTILLDVRTPEEYAEGHIAGSVNIDFKSPDFASRVDSLDKSKSYDLYCRSGHRSGESLKLMEEKGFTKVHHLEGGILKWQESGQPVVK